MSVQNTATRHEQSIAQNIWGQCYSVGTICSKDSCGEICKYFGIDKVEESIRHRQEKLFNRYSGYSNSLCHSIFARL